MKFKSSWYPRALLLVLVLALGWVYLRGIDAEPMFDDNKQISLVGNFQSVADTFAVDCFGLFRPVKNLIFYTWVKTMPGDVKAWRITSLLLFIGLIPIAYLFFGLFFKDKPWLQLLCTTLWASAPVTTAVVCWPSSTNIIVGCYGLLLYFLLYEKAKKQQDNGHQNEAYAWRFLSLLCFAFACLSYEAAITAPFLLFLKEYALDRERLQNKQNWLFLFLSGFTLVLYFLLRKTYGGMNSIQVAPMMPTSSDLWVSLGSGWITLFHALRWLWPFGHQGILILFNPEDSKALVVFAAIAVFGLGILIVLLRNRKPLVFMSLGWYGLALFPMANVIPLRNGPICDYYLFIPGLGLALFFTWLFKTLRQTKAGALAGPLAVTLILAFFVTTFFWVPYWKTEDGLSRRTLAWQPKNFVVIAQLGQEALEKNETEKAEAYFAEALALAPWLASLQYQMALLKNEQGRHEEAINTLEHILTKQSFAAKPHIILAQIYDRDLGDWKKAEQLLTTALEKPWDDTFSKVGALHLSSIYLRTGRKQFAIKLLDSLKERFPYDEKIAAIRSSIMEAEQPNL